MKTKYFIGAFVVTLTILVSCGTQNNPEPETDFGDNPFGINEWNTDVDSMMGFEILYPNFFKSQYGITHHLFKNYSPDTIDEYYWKVERFPRPYYERSSWVQDNIEFYDSAQVTIDGTPCTHYFPNELEMEDWMYPEAIRYETEHFIFDLSTPNSNDTLFYVFAGSIIPNKEQLNRDNERLAKMNIELDSVNASGDFGNYFGIEFELIHDSQFKRDEKKIIPIRTNDYDDLRFTFWTSCKNCEYVQRFKEKEFELTPTKDTLIIEVTLRDNLYNKVYPLERTRFKVN